MTDSATYSIIVGDEFQAGFDPEQVRDAFAALCKVPPEKAAGLLNSRRVLKKNADRRTAERYRSKLEGIGLVVTLQRQGPPKPTAATLSLVADDDQDHSGASPAPAERARGTASDTIRCPKCESEQPSGAERCDACGVFLHKVLNRAGQGPAAAADALGPSPDSAAYAAEKEGVSAVSLAAGVVAAVIGAYLWKFIALTFGLELGLIAWVVGGMVGLAVAIAGGKGHVSGIACGVLAVLAILGGKYMIYSGLQETLSEMGDFMKEMAEYAYVQEMDAAEAYGDGLDGMALREFMIEYEYTFAAEPADIGEDEVDEFNRLISPRLGEYAHTRPEFDQWYREVVEAELDGLTTTGLMTEMFGWVDLLFLLLGVGTAYRLGRGEYEA